MFRLADADRASNTHSKSIKSEQTRGASTTIKLAETGCLTTTMRMNNGGKLHQLENLLILSMLGVGALAFHRWKWQDEAKKKRAVPDAFLESSFRRELQVAIELAMQAGKKMVAYCDEKGTESEQNHDLDIATKSAPEDFCTKVDVENEHLVIAGLNDKFPSHRVIGEETVGTGQIPSLTNDPTWIIDPIDGTTNFASGLPLTCVSIGLCVDGRPVMGVVYAPVTDELFVAVKGYGAYRNGVKITHRDHKPLLDSVVCYELGYPRDKASIKKMVGAIQRVLEHGCRTFRTLGSGVLDLCYVATGRLDVVYAGVAGEGWKPWDYCAGLVVAEEAGCSVEAIHPQPDNNNARGGCSSYDIYSDSIICAVSQQLVSDVRRVIVSS